MKKTHLFSTIGLALLVTVIASGCFSSGPAKKTYADCDKMNNAEEKGTCYYDVISDKKEFEKCDTLEHVASKERCYNAYAQDKLDKAICEKITTNAEMKQSCVKSVDAAAVFSEDACKKLPTSAEKDGCYKYAAQDRQDLSLCREIEDKNMRNECIEAVKNMQK